MSEPVNYIITASKRAAAFEGQSKGPDSSPLHQFLEAVRSDSNVSIVKVAGNSEDPKRVLVKMDPATAERVKQRFGSRCLIERDEPLELF